MNRLVTMALFVAALAISIALFARPGAVHPTTTEAVATVEIDFNKVDWGTIMPGLKETVYGNLLWEAPTGMHPTVRNTGDTAAYICLQFSDMVGESPAPKISSFAAFFLPQNTPPYLGEMIDPIAAGTQACFTNPLGPGEWAELDLLLHPPVPLPPAVYVGTVTVSGTVVPIQAQVVPQGGVAPIVDATWELPDMQPLVTGFQYSASPPTDLNLNGTPDADDDPLRTGIQMYLNPRDEPSGREIEDWAIVEDPDGVTDIQSVWADIWQPDGSFKYEVELAPVACSVIGLYDDSVSPPVVEIYDPLNAAIDTNQITKAAAESFIERCYNEEVVVYTAVQTLAQAQMAGEYAVNGYAQDNPANVGTMTNYFEVMAPPAVPVGGIQALPDAAASAGDSSALLHVALACVAAAAVGVLVLGGWHVGRRRLR